MQLRKILVATDFSKEADVALGQALRIARHVGAEIILLHVFDVADSVPLSPVAIRAKADQLQDRAELLRSQNREQLAALRRRVKGQGVKVSHMVVAGFPDAGICNGACDVRADLIAVGTLGLTGIRRFLVGSVAETVARLADTSVMVARKEPDSPATGGGFRRILVPSDLSEGAQLAGSMAQVLAAPDASIDVLHVCFQEHEGGAGKAVADWTHAAFDGPDGRADLTIGQRVVAGSPAEGIQEHLAGGSYDLVVIGSHGWRGFRPGLLGSVAERTIRHSSCSVVVTRPPRR